MRGDEEGEEGGEEGGEEEQGGKATNLAGI